MTVTRNKFGAIKVKDDGFTFDSKAEHRRYCELKMLYNSGQIYGLVVHKVYPIIIGGLKICDVKADFTYFECSTAKTVNEDVKGMDTRISALKRKLLLATYPGIIWRVVKT